MHSAIVGTGSISARVVAKSISHTGKLITTFELEYPRFVHAELMTHRVFSRNAASSRAIPVERMVENIKLNTAQPVFWGKNQAGMQAVEECNEFIWVWVDGQYTALSRDSAWKYARDSACELSLAFHRAGFHKQIVNRITEPYQMMKTIVTSTEYNNWDWLRDHKDAQPEIHELARVRSEAYQKAEAVFLRPGEWHTPYYEDGFWKPSSTDSIPDDALRISASCCAQVSYRKNDDSLEKAMAVFARLVESEPVHASPTEHQATPIRAIPSWYVHPKNWDEGVTHMDRVGGFWSGNFSEWIQFRQLIPNNAVYG